jgi:anhydro-N-acetylmuramic acid kinase
MSELYIGLMSGTSMDAIDAVLVDFSDGIRLAGTHSHPLPPSLRSRLSELCQSRPDEIERMGRIDVELGQLFADTALELLEGAEHHAGSVRAIGSHGQTIRHRPRSSPAFTLQIGDPNTIAERTGISVVADFRRRDMAAGGQGAPLVPAFHAGVFGSTSHNRIVLNLGGIANVSIIPAGKPASTSGFDTGPANTLLDAWCQLKKDQPFDVAGEWAASGDVDTRLLEQLLKHPFFSQPHPKSTGREDFNLSWLRDELDRMGRPIDDVDVQATLLMLTARSVADEIASSGMEEGELLICGGGAFNTTLWQQLQALLPTWSLRSTADFGLAPGWVEATAFAWLARQTMLGLPGNLPAVTGAAGPRVLGAIHPA